jgi:hypothetical protein
MVYQTQETLKSNDYEKLLTIVDYHVIYCIRVMPKAVHTYVHHDRKPVCIAEELLSLSKAEVLVREDTRSFFAMDDHRD